MKNNLKEKADDVVIVLDGGKDAVEQSEKRKNFGVEAKWAEEKNIGGVIKCFGIGISAILCEKAGLSFKIWREK